LPSLRVGQALGIILSLSALLRLARLESWPVFLDEDNYTQAALDMLTLAWPEVFWRSSEPPTLKLPLLFFLHSWLIRLVGEPVVAGRLLAAIAGVVTTLLTFLLGRRLATDSVGLLAAAIYALSPVAVLHERMVLQDGPMTTAALGSLLLSWSALERGSWRRAIGAAALGALAVQCKVPAVALIALQLVLMLVVAGSLARRLALASIAAAGPLLSYLAVMLSPLGQSQTRENELMISQPLSMLGAHLETLLDSINSYFPLGLGLLVLVGAIVALRQRPRVALLFLTALAAWSLPWIVFSKFAPSRYFLPAVPFASALIALALSSVLQASRTRGLLIQVAAGAAGAILLLASGVASLWLVLDHRAAPMSKLDNWQYQSGWPSGYGYQEAARFVAETAEPGWSVAYVIRSSHQIAAGVRSPLPPGVSSQGIHDLERPRLDLSRPTYVLVDDSRAAEGDAGERVRELLARERRLRELTRFTRPGSKTGVSVLRTP
jgi:4-amino-4-deoxy-L-arabinose transferase-like glycosyltransferase